MKIFKGFFDRAAVIREMNKRAIRYLYQAAGYVRRIAKSSIIRKGRARKEPKKYSAKGGKTKAWIRWWREVQERPTSAPGQPPYTHGGLLREAIQFGVDRANQEAVAGPLMRTSGAKEMAQLHEFGGERFGRKYPARSYMGAALRRATPKLAEFLKESRTY